MKNIILIFVLTSGLMINAQSNEVQTAIETFFVGFHAKDSVKMKTICSDKMTMQSISEDGKNVKLSDENVHNFFKTVATLPSTLVFEERILDYKIQIDGSMAHAWTPYELYFNGKLYSSGVNAFTLVKQDEVWKIIFLIDTRRKAK